MNLFKRVCAFHIELEFGGDSFEERVQLEYPEKNLLEQGRKPTTNSNQWWLWCQDLNPGHIGGRWVLSPLPHPCSIVYILLIGKLRHQHAMVPLAAAINTGGGGGGVFIVIGFGFPITWRIMQVLEGVMGLCPTAAILSQETKVALFYLSSLTPKFFTARLRLVKQNFFESLRTIWLAWK